jgi:hypothetical protein
MKKLVILIALLGLALFLGVMNVGCHPESAYVGMWVGVGFNDGAWLDIKADGTFQGTFIESGSWEVIGDQLRLTYEFGHSEYFIEDGKLTIQKGGEVFFVKQ